MRTVKAKLKNRDDELLQTLVRELGKTEEEILAQGVRALYGDIMLGQGSAMTRLSENDYHECLKRARENSKNPEAILRQEETQKRAVLWDSL